MKFKTSAIFFFLLFFASSLTTAKVYKRIPKSELEIVIQQLEKEGFKKKTLQEIFHQIPIGRFPIQIRRNVINKVQGNPYKRFLTKSSIKSAQKFYEKWERQLLKAQKKFYVDAKVIVAILLVETSLGSYTGKYPLLSLFSSLYLENQPNRLKLLKKEWRVTKKSSADQKYYLKRLRSKSGWAFKQLKSMVEMHQKGVDIGKLRGSYAGAFGLCQFIPASYLHYAYSPKNKVPDLFDPVDAIYSIANYLRKNGWRKKMTVKKIKKSIWRYNHSKRYVNTVYKISKLIKP